MLSKIKFVLVLMVLIGLVACDSSTSSNENNDDNQPSVEILRAIVTNTGDNDAEINYSLLITNVTGQESLGGGMTIGAGNSIPSILGESEPGATGISVEVEVLGGGPVRLAIERGILDDGFFEGTELMFVSGGAGQTVTLEYSGN
jgi:hypothetical protein